MPSEPAALTGRLANTMELVETPFNVKLSSMRKVASDLIARLVPRYFRPHMDYARLRVASVSRFYRMEFISLLLVLAEITAGTPAATQTSFRHPKAGPRPKPGTDVTAERFDPAGRIDFFNGQIGTIQMVSVVGHTVRGGER